MTTKLIPALIVFMLFFISSIHAQVNTEDINAYPLVVALKVKDVASTVTLSEEKQLLLAKFFYREDAVILNAQKAETTSQQLAVIKSQLKAEFQSILSPQELLVYSSKRKDAPYAKTETVVSSQ